MALSGIEWTWLLAKLVNFSLSVVLELLRLKSEIFPSGIRRNKDTNRQLMLTERPV